MRLFLKAHAIQPGLKRLPQVSNTIAIASNKGGVGKSTTAVNVALALVKQGYRVGLLDADIYGPSQLRCLGLSGQAKVNADGLFEPFEAYGLVVNSMAALVDDESAMLWRGPMASKALAQLMLQTAWSALDVLIIDMPPGTGDLHISLMQKMPLTAGVIVTTPQDLALIDAKRALQMFNKLNIPVLGVIENMSQYTCSQCGHNEAIFGEQGGAEIAKANEMPLLGVLPLAMQIRQDVDAGKPTVVADASSAATEAYLAIASSMLSRLSYLKADYSVVMPPIKVKEV